MLIPENLMKRVLIKLSILFRDRGRKKIKAVLCAWEVIRAVLNQEQKWQNVTVT